MQEHRPAVIQLLSQEEIKLCKADNFARPGRLHSSPVSRQLQDFHSLGPPFACRILFGRNADFLPDGKAVHLAFSLLAGRDFITENDHCMGDFHPPKHVISALYEDPSRSAGP